MADKINQIEIGGITYDLQDKKSIFSGTAEEYEATADTIEDGTVVNITDDFVEGETLDTYVLNKVNELEDKLGSGIKTREELMANGEEGKLADALAIKEAVEYTNVAKHSSKSYLTLEEFVETTATDISVPNIGRFKDAGGFIGGTVTWYRYVIAYQSVYAADSDANVRGNGVFWNDNGQMYNIFISGNKDAGLTLKYELINQLTIKTKNDLMANTVSGLFPDALAVKEGLKEINDSLGNVKTANCYLIGETVEGDLGYVENIAEYVTFGSLIFVKYRLTINNVITHPLGNVRIKLDIPELINKNTSLSSGGSISYVMGGYKSCLRRWVVTDIYSKGLMEPRGLIMSNEGLKPALQGSAFVDDIARMSENNNNFHLINEDGSVNARIRGSFFAILS